MNLNELGNTPLQDTVDFDNLPAERGAFAPPPVPGPYRFALSPLTDANFSPIPESKSGPRVQVHFNDAAPLAIVDSPGDVHNGEPFETRISNVPRQRGKDESQVASDWDYLNKALKVAKKPATNKAYCEQLMADSMATPPKQFGADIEWTWNCNEKRDAYFADGSGGSAPVPDQHAPGKNIQGCGAKYYQGQTAKVADVTNKKAGYIAKAVEVEGQPAVYPLRIECACGATVRAFANLARIRE